MRDRRTLLASVLAIGVIVVTAVRPTLLSGQAAPRHVVVVSIDGLKPSAYTTAGPAKVPTLRQIARDGVYADGVRGVLPTSTYPSHTTLITGVQPAVHGIYNNRILDPDESSNNSWYWYARDVKVPTLPVVLEARGLTTAAVSWPVTVDADIDYLVPEFAGVTRHPKWLELIRALAKPHHLLDAYEAQGAPLSWPMTDGDRTGLAAWIFRTYRPNLLLLHIFATDEAQHSHGPDSPEALAATEAADTHVQQIVRAITDTGLGERTDLVVLSDHGFAAIETLLQLNFAFKQAGLLDVDAAGRISRWDAYLSSAGGSGFVMLRNPDDAALRERVRALLTTIAADPANGILTVWNRDELRVLGADPRASFGIDMKDGFYTAAGVDVLIKPSPSKGGHGFAPSHTSLYSSLVMRGPDVPKTGSLGIIRSSQVAPTIASWFGAALSPLADTPLVLPATVPSGR